jgi:hypothetical protein
LSRSDAALFLLSDHSMSCSGKSVLHDALVVAKDFIIEKESRLPLVHFSSTMTALLDDRLLLRIG